MAIPGLARMQVALSAQPMKLHLLCDSALESHALCVVLVYHAPYANRNPIPNELSSLVISDGD
jgi:hypothetical protein